MIKKLFITLLLFCFYVNQAWGAMIIQQFTSASNPTLIFSSNFETTGDRDQWVCQVGTCAFDHAESTGCSGGGDCDMVDNSVAELSPESIMYADLDGDQSEFYVVFAFRVEETPAETQPIYQINNNTGGENRLAFYSNGRIYSSFGGFNAYWPRSDAAGPADTTWWIQYHWKSGTTVTAELETKFYDSGWGSWTSTTASETVEADIDRIRFLNEWDEVNQRLYIDHVFVYTQEITVDPRTLPL